MKLTYFNYWAKQPITRISIYFASGCVFSQNVAYSIQIINLFSFIFLIIFFALLYLHLFKPSISKHKTFIIRGFFISLLFLLLGFINGVVLNNTNEPINQNEHFVGHISTFLIEVDSEPRLKSGFLSVDCKIFIRFNNSEFKPIFNKVRIQVKNGDPLKFQLAQRKLVFGKMEYPSPVLIPGEFDYCEFLHSKGIRYIMRTNQSHIFHLSDATLSFQRIAFNLRANLLTRFQNDILKPEEKQVASALLLGERSEMNSELIKDYASGGIIHILAVSGLHVGLIYQLCVWLFKYAKFFHRKRFDVLIIIVLLWIYATMTGLSPSVNRAVCMFTLLALAEFLNRRVSPFNILSSAALFLLIVKPNSIFDMGFQLSFAAVWGILSARPLLDKLKSLPGKFTSFILTPIVISIAAQIATAPFVLYTFGSFPTWFLPANLIAVPLSTILTYLGIASLFFANIPVFGWLLMSLFSKGLQALNYWARIISDLPFAQLNNLKIGLPELLCFSFAVFVLFSFLHNRNFKRIQIFFYLIILGNIAGYLELIVNKPKRFPLIYCSQNALHVHFYSNSIDHHFILFRYDIKQFKMPELNKMINSIFIGSNRVDVHPVIFNKQRSGLSSNNYSIEHDTIIQMHTNYHYYDAKHYQNLIVINPSIESLRNLKKNKSKYFIPVPWMSKIQKERLKMFAQNEGIGYYDPLKFGWRHFPNK